MLKETNLKKYVAAILHRKHCKIVDGDKAVKCLGILGVPMKDILLIDVNSIAWMILVTLLLKGLPSAL